MTIRLSRRKTARQVFDELVRLDLGGWLYEDGSGSSILVWRRDRPDRRFRITGDPDGSFVWQQLGQRGAGTTIQGLREAAR